MSRLSRIWLWMIFGVASGCGHTHAATDVPAEAAVVEPAPRPKHHAPKADGGTAPLFASPEAALAPDGIEKIQERLVARGDLDDADTSGHLDDATKRALIALQKKHNLPATGVPDDTTVRKLGLDPAQIFRRAP